MEAKLSTEIPVTKKTLCLAPDLRFLRFADSNLTIWLLQQGHSVVRIRVDVRVPLRPHVAGWVTLAEPGGTEILRQVGAPATAEPNDDKKDAPKEVVEMP